MLSRQFVWACFLSRALSYFLRELCDVTCFLIIVHISPLSCTFSFHLSQLQTLHVRWTGRTVNARKRKIHKTQSGFYFEFFVISFFFHFAISGHFLPFSILHAVKMQKISNLYIESEA